VKVDDARRQSIAIDVRALNAERLSRAQAGMKAAGLPAALLFDPANVCNTTCDGQFLVATCTATTAGRWSPSSDRVAQ
jgi:hypothetical protein